MAARRSAPTTSSSIKRGAGLLALAYLAACAGLPPRGEMALGDSAFHQGRDQEAAKHYALAVEAAKAAPNSPELVQALNSLAAVERMAGRYEKAADSYRESASHLEKSPGHNPIVLRNIYFDLAEVRTLEGKLKEADEAYRRFLELVGTAVDPGGEELAGELVAAGQYFALQERFIDAVQCYKRALTIRERILPPGSSGIAELNQDIEAAMKALRNSSSEVPPPGANR